MRLDMTLSIVPMDLGKAGLTYMKESYEGREPVASFALSYLNRCQHALTFVPKDTSMAQALKFREWAFFKGQARGTTKAIVDYLLNTHRQHPGYCLVVLDFCLQSDDNHAAEYGRTFYYGKHIFKYLNGADFTAESLEETLHTAAEPSMGFLIDGIIDDKAAFQKPISQKVFDQLFNNIKMVTLTVYDGESDLLAF